jgi:hypothetical protein
MYIEYNASIIVVLVIYFLAMALITGLITYYYRDKK